jgi:hypothetical protein
MGMVGGFEHDVFISYAHIDNVPYGVRQTCWVDEFAQDLQSRLSMVTGSRAAVWRDPRLRGHQLLWPAIRKALAASAVFIAVVSPRYVASDSCRQEWSSFDTVSLLPDAAVLPIVTRLLHIIKLPVDRSKLPALIQDQLGYDFFTPHPITGDPFELDRSNPAYFERINALARDIRDLLEQIDSACATGTVS